MPRIYGQSQVPTALSVDIARLYRPTYWKVLGQALEDRVFLTELRQTGAHLLGRLFIPEVDGTWKDGWLEDFLRKVIANPVDMAAWYMNRIAFHSNFDLVEFWETPNEPFGQMHADANPHLVPAYDRFMQILSTMLIRKGKFPVVGNMGSGAWAGQKVLVPIPGAPNLPPIEKYLLDFRNLFSNTALLNPIWGHHEYGWPTILSQMEHRVTEPARHGLAHFRIEWPGAIWLTEIGVTQAVDGIGPDVGFFSKENAESKQYSSMLQDYDNIMKADAAFLFLTGAAKDWRERGFESTDTLELIYQGIRGKGRPRHLADYDHLYQTQRAEKQGLRGKS